LKRKSDRFTPLSFLLFILFVPYSGAVTTAFKERQEFFLKRMYLSQKSIFKNVSLKKSIFKKRISLKKEFLLKKSFADIESSMSISQILKSFVGRIY